MTPAKHIGTCLRAARAAWRAYRKSRRPRRTVEPTVKQMRRGRKRRRALARLGGRCACCGLGMEFWPALSVHHVNHNGSEHREVRGALGLSIEGDILTRDDPTAGLFALMPLCQVCHTMIHAQGYCPHERRRERAA